MSAIFLLLPGWDASESSAGLSPSSMSLIRAIYTQIKVGQSFFSRVQETNVELELKIPTRYSASPVTSKCNSDPPAEVNGKERSKRPSAKNLLGNRADAKRLGRNL